VHAEDGLDEISLATSTHVAEYKAGVVEEYDITPEAMGIERQSLIGLTVDSAEQSLKLIKDALGEQQTPEGKKAADMLALNAGPALYVCGIADTLKAGVELAQQTIASGSALQKMVELKQKSQGYHHE